MPVTTDNNTFFWLGNPALYFPLESWVGGGRSKMCKNFDLFKMIFDTHSAMVNHHFGNRCFPFSNDPTSKSKNTHGHEFSCNFGQP